MKAANYKFFNGVVKICNKEFIQIKCLFFDSNTNKCTIYDHRPDCCKNYPLNLPGHYCTDEECIICFIRVENNTEASSDICMNQCKDHCCNKIYVPKNIEVTEDFLYRWLHMKCEYCRNIFK